MADRSPIHPAGFEYRQRSCWPTLAWIARLPQDHGPIAVEHGPGVETHDGWFGDAVWDGPLAEGRFDQTDTVFGSGACFDRYNGVTFVSSTATVDRLHWFLGDHDVWVSNTLAGLLRRIKAELDPWYAGYPRLFETITQGIDRYTRVLPTSRGPVRLTYFHNLRWREGQLQENPKPRSQTPDALASFTGYQNFLTDAITRLCSNAQDTARRRPFVSLGTISSGFDSPAAAALARRAGLAEAFTLTTARDGHDDSGAAIGERLGLHVHLIDRDTWRKQPLIETKFLASDAKGEDVYFAGAGSLLSNRIVFTGFAAGPWKRSVAPNLDLHRADQSGLSLTEYRLHAGFVHIPVPTIGAQYGEPLHRMIHSGAMDAWVSGRPYDKPFCRRVLVESGVPADMFGQDNKAASILFFDRHSFLSERSWTDYQRHLLDAQRHRPRRATKRAAVDLGHRVLSAAVRNGQATCAAGHRITGLPLLDRLTRSGRLTTRARYATAYRYLFPWAVGHAAQHYAETDS